MTTTGKYIFIIFVLLVVLLGGGMLIVLNGSDTHTSPRDSDTSKQGIDAPGVTGTTTENPSIDPKDLLAGDVASGSEMNDEADVVGSTPQELVESFMRHISDGDISAAHQQVMTSRQGTDSSGLEEVVDAYHLEGNDGVEFTAATGTATSSILTGVINRSDRENTEFQAVLIVDEGEWMINQFFVFGQNLPGEEPPLSDQRLRSLASNTAMMLADAIESDDYQALYDHFAPDVLEDTPLADFKAAYENLSEENQERVVETIREHTGGITVPARMNENQLIMMEYGYQSAPQPFSIRFVFAEVDGEWRPAQANFK